VQPDFVHVFVGGRIVEEGGPELAQVLEDDGYERFTAAAVAGGTAAGGTAAGGTA
jgi:Fe-S cluster assembly ATP-binding protein